MLPYTCIHSLIRAILAGDLRSYTYYNSKTLTYNTYTFQKLLSSGTDLVTRILQTLRSDYNNYNKYGYKSNRIKKVIYMYFHIGAPCGVEVAFSVNI